MAVEVEIDGRGPFRFLVDTGADRTIVSTETAQALGLVTGTDVVVQGISQSIPAPTVSLKNVSIGNIFVDEIKAPILPRAMLETDGYIGLDVLAGRKVTFDFLHDQLTVDHSDGRSGWIHSHETIVHANGTGGRLTAVDSSVDGVTADAFLDSGAEVSIGNTQLYDALHDEGAIYDGDPAVPIIGVTGGHASGRFLTVRDVKMGALHFYHCHLVISDLEIFRVWELTDRPALFIGMNFLRQMSSVAIDFGRREIRFRLADVRIASRV